MRCFWIFLIFISNWVFGQSQSTSYDTMLKTMLSRSVPIISATELNQTKNAIILDTRQKVEFNVSHIKGAQWVGYEEFNAKKMRNVAKNTPIIVYCSVGYRSEKIGEKLLAMGYKNVKNLWGGIFDWVNDGQILTDNTNQPTTKVHGYSPTWGVWLTKGEKVFLPKVRENEKK